MEEAVPFRFFKHVVSENANAFISPVGLINILYVVLLGVKGKSAEQIDNILQGLHYFSDEGSATKVSNTIFVREGIELLETFCATLRQYKTEHISFNLENISVLANEWVTRVTDGFMKELNLNVSMETRLIILNTLYFKSCWLHRFYFTHPTYFHINKQMKKLVPMMMLRHERFKFFEDTKCKAIKLPFQDQETHMIVFFPHVDLASLEKKFTAKYMNYIISKMETKKLSVVMIPKFTLKYSYNLKPFLRQLGVEDIFDPFKSDCSRMTQYHSFVSKMFQSTYLEVNEEGVKAISMSYCESEGIRKTQLLSFIANRPFLFIISTENNILFMGKLSDPMTEK